MSRVDIFTRQTRTPAASLHLEGGVPGQVEETGCPEGTTICVRDLFYNTPARMKFMKKDSAEGRPSRASSTHLALSHPEVSFKLIRDGAEVLHTPGDGSSSPRSTPRWGGISPSGSHRSRGCGGDVAGRRLCDKAPLRQRHAGRQLFFRERPVRQEASCSPAALEEAYRNRLLKGKFPGCVLHIEPARRTGWT